MTDEFTDRDQQTFIGLNEAELEEILHSHFPEEYPASSLSSGLTPFQQERIDEGKAASLILGPYLLESRIGAGGMGEVYQALHRRMQRRVAIKLLSTGLLNDEQAVARFLREIQIVSNLKHPGIVTAFDAHVHDEEHYLVMELVSGLDLEQVVQRQGPVSVPDAIEIIRQAANALHCMHEQEMVHRDIKPSNLMIDEAGVVKVTDFGLAKLTDVLPENSTKEITHTGVITGSIDYLAPEQARSFREAKASADIYSLGCTLYFLLTGRPPYEADSLIETLQAHQTAPIPDLRSTRAEIPRQLDRLFREMIAKDPHDRPASMAQVEQRLNQIREKRYSNGRPAWKLNFFARETAQPIDPTLNLAALTTLSAKPPLLNSVKTRPNPSHRSIAHSMQFYEWLLLIAIIVACAALWVG